MVQKTASDYDILVGLATIIVRFSCLEGTVDVPFQLTPEEASIVEMKNDVTDAVLKYRRARVK